MAVNEKKRGLSVAESDSPKIAPIAKRARLDRPQPAYEESSNSEQTTTPSPPSVTSDDVVSVNATSFTTTSGARRPKKYICEYEDCQKAFDRPVRLQAHLRTHTNDRPFVCDEEDCDKAFFKAEHLKAHIQNKHSIDASHVCTYVISISVDGEDQMCGKTFTTTSRLKRHAAIHEKAEELKCNELGCGQVFRKMETLQRHIKKEHWQEDSFCCDKVVFEELSGVEVPCGQTFSTASLLKTHETQKHGILKHFCTICSPPGSDASIVVGFPTYSEYQAHLKTEHPPSCTICHQTCASNRALAAHMDIEHSTLDSRKQNYTCTYPGCDRGFTRKGNLNVHIQTVHMKKSKFVCGNFDLSGSDKCSGWKDGMGCGRSFSTKASLEGHVRTQHLDLPALNYPRKSRKIKKETSTGTSTPMSSMELDDPSEFDDMFGESHGVALLTGQGYVEANPIVCWTPECSVRFSREYELAQHMELTHGWNVDDINDQLIEQQALEGGQFWVRGIGETDDGLQPLVEKEEESLRKSLSQALTLQADGDEDVPSDGMMSKFLQQDMGETFGLGTPDLGHDQHLMYADGSAGNPKWASTVGGDQLVLDPALLEI